MSAAPKRALVMSKNPAGEVQRPDHPPIGWKLPVLSRSNTCTLIE
jgi:hypothetical protein